MRDHCRITTSLILTLLVIFPGVPAAAYTVEISSSFKIDGRQVSVREKTGGRPEFMRFRGQASIEGEVRLVVEMSRMTRPLTEVSKVCSIGRASKACIKLQQVYPNISGTTLVAAWAELDSETQGKTTVSVNDTIVFEGTLQTAFGPPVSPIDSPIQVPRPVAFETVNLVEVDSLMETMELLSWVTAGHYELQARHLTPMSSDDRTADTVVPLGETIEIAEIALVVLQKILASAGATYSPRTWTAQELAFETTGPRYKKADEKEAFLDLDLIENPPTVQ